ncbi:MAG: transporter substrate-binding domain-containing protein, partial [Desulfobacteraceae bacterium]
MGRAGQGYALPVLTILALVLLGPPFASAELLSKKEKAFLRDKQTVVFVSQTRYPPFEFVDQSGERTGMCIELARWMATELGFTARFSDMSFQEAQKAVRTGEAEVLTSFFYSKKRDEQFDFTPVMFEVPASIFVVAERTDIKELRDLEGKNIAMQKGDYAKEYLDSAGISFDVRYTKDFAEATDLVVSGSADAVIGDEQIVLYHIFKNRLTDQIKKVGDPLYIGKNCMATQESNPVLVGILSKGISLARENGVLEKIHRKWIGTMYSEREPSFSRFVPHILAAVCVCFVLVLIVWFWNVRLRQEVGKRTEEVKRSEKRFRNLFERSSDAIYIADHHGCFLDVNPAMERLCGYSREELLGMKTEDFYVNPDERPGVLKELDRGPIQDYEIKFRDKNGNERDCTVTASVRHDDGGRIIGYEGTIRDVTKRRRLEAQLQRAQKMEAVGTLAGGVAHDLNNILSGLVSYPDLLLMQLPEDSPLITPLMTIKRSGLNASAVVEDLLTMARRGVAALENVNLNQVIQNYLESPEYQKLKFMHPDVEVSVDLAEDLLSISASPIHLSKTVMNLLNNAAEAMPRGGPIRISTRNQYVDTPIRGYDHVNEGDYVTLRISDTGVGISPEDLNRIFEPFYTKKVLGRSGSGLGMAVVWGTVKDHHGYIDVRSSEGDGTVFTLYFPALRKKASEVEQKGEAPVDAFKARGETLLVVDDVKEQRDIASEILSSLGYSVAAVASGGEAIAYLKEHPVDLIVLDMIMDPGMDGLELYRRILEIRPGQ